MRDAYSDDLSDFIRNGQLDGYELTDEELVQFLEIWRWVVWTRRRDPTGADHDIMDALNHLCKRLDERHAVEIEYNTLLLLRQELEPLMHFRVLADMGRAVRYFISPLNWWSFLKTWWRVRRYQSVRPVVYGREERRGYPAYQLDHLRETAPDLVKRKYWRRVGAPKDERHPHMWW